MVKALAFFALLTSATSPLAAQAVDSTEFPIPQLISTDDTPADVPEDSSFDALLQRLGKAETRLAELEALDQKDIESTAAKVKKLEEAPNLTYGKDGFEFETDDGDFSLAIQNRLQVRAATPFDNDPRRLSDLDRDQSSLMVRRARTKLRGHAYYSWLQYNFQYDWSDPILRDFNLSIAKYEWASVDIGRQKVVYNDERKTSSGNQQFVNRSIVNDIFTVDRQQGIQVYGNLFPETTVDTTYYLGVFTGLGVGERNNDDDNLMYNARLQWNALGGEMPFGRIRDLSGIYVSASDLFEDP